MVDDRFRRHPVTGCAAGYDLCHAAKPTWTPIAAFEFMALTAAFAFQDPLNVFCPSRNWSLPSRELAAILSRRNTHDPRTPALRP
jgi:hypothetical protein